ncbi:MAG: FG-GAP repeat protein [Rhodocyclaceae bacterium]|nr:FG-GAP repeat protein [Rhodocyclaceae bacterium]
MANGTGGVVFQGVVEGGLVGTDLAGIGDINADGFSDIAISAPFGGGYDNEFRGTYAAFVVMGGGTVWPDTVQLYGTEDQRVAFYDAGSFGYSEPYPSGGTASGDIAYLGDINGDGYDDWLINTPVSTGVYLGAEFQFGVADAVNPYSYLFTPWSFGASDINGDGIADIFVGMPGIESPEYTQGSIRIFMGSSDGYLSHEYIDGQNSFSILGEAYGDLAGYAVANAGDFNGDGVEDLLIGSPGFDDQRNGLDFPEAGAAYVIYGDEGLTMQDISLSELDSQNGFRLAGDMAGDQLGYSVSSIGDVNGDGFDDIAIAAPYADVNGLEDAGRVYLVFGGQEYSDQFGLEDHVGHGVVRIDGATQHGLFGASVSAAGDANGDGIADLLIGAPGADGQGQPGEAYLVFGRDSWLGSYFEPTYNINDIAWFGYRFTGVNPDDHAGSSVAGVGDTNDDGIDDFMIGARGADPNGLLDAGVAYLVYGGAFRLGAVDEFGGPADGSIALADLALPIAAPSPVATDDAYSGTLLVDGGGIGFEFDPSWNDFSQTDTPLRIVGLDTSGIQYGTVDFYRAGDFDREVDTVVYSGSQYTSLAFSALKEGESLVEHLTYTVEDAIGGQATATVTFTIRGANDSPQALPDMVIRDGSADYVIDVLANDWDPEGAPLTVTSVSAPLGGTADINPDGTVSFRPTPGYVGPDRFTYTVSDGEGGTATGRVDIPVLADYAGLTLMGESIQAQAGTSVASAGDFNGDGIDDVIVGSPGYFTGADLNAGAAYVVFGSRNGLPAELELAALDGESGMKLSGAEFQQGLGYSVAGIGDVNGDGIDDVIVGAGISYGDLQGNYAAFSGGDAFVVFGGHGGLPSNLDLSTLDGSQGFRIDADGLAATPNTVLATSVASAGDVNADGINDVLVSIMSLTGDALETGGFSLIPQSESAYILFGSNLGFAAGVSLVDLPSRQGIHLSMGATAAMTPGGVLADGLNTAAGGGDINGDGIDDILFGVPFLISDGVASGAVYVAYGSPGVDGALNVDDLDGSNGFRIDGINPYDRFGSTVAFAGDINGDGIDDIAISAPSANALGEAYIVFGSPAGFPAVMDAADLNGSNGFRFEGSGRGNWGFTVAGAGDLNADGFDDLVMGARLGTDSGEAYVVFGSDAGFPAVIDQADLDGKLGYVLSGRDGGDSFGSSVAPAGDVNGDGIADLIIGARTADIGDDWQLGNAGEAYVIFGGSDALSVIDALDGTRDGRIDAEILMVESDTDSGEPHVFSAIAASTVTEGDTGSSPMTFTISRTGSTAGEVRVDYRIEGGSVSPAGADDVQGSLPVSGFVTFADGETVKSVSIEVVGDLLVEPNESLRLTLTGGEAENGAPVGFLNGSVNGLIQDDDETPVISVSTVRVTESDEETVDLPFTFTRSGGLEDTITVSYSVSGTGAHPADAGDLSVPLPGTGQVVFAPGETSKVINLGVLGDEEVESNERVSLTITEATSDAGRSVQVATPVATAVILNDDEPSTVTVEAERLYVSEGISRWGNEPGSTDFVFTRTGDLDTEITVDYFVSTSVLEPRPVPILLFREISRGLIVGDGLAGFRWVDTAITFAEEAQRGDDTYLSKQLVPHFELDVPLQTFWESLVADVPWGDVDPNGNGQLFSVDYSSSGSFHSLFDYAFGFDLGLGFGLDFMSGGSFSLDYPVVSSLRIPTFVNSGEGFTISSGTDYHSGAVQATGSSFGFGEMGLYLTFSADPSDFEGIDQFGMTNFTPLTVFGEPLLQLDDVVFEPVTDVAIPLLTVSAGSYGGELDKLAKLDLLDGVEYEFSLPSGEEKTVTVQAGAPGSLSPVLLAIEESLATVSFNIAELLSKIPALTGLDALSEDYNFDTEILGKEIKFSAEYTALGIKVSGGYGLVQEYEFTPTDVLLTVTANGQQQQGKLGDSFNFDTPESFNGVIDGSVQYQLNGLLDINYKLAPIGAIAIEVLSANIGGYQTDADAAGSGDQWSWEFGPVFEQSFSGSTDFGSIDLFRIEDIVLGSDFLEPVTENFRMAVGEIPENTLLAGQITFAPGEFETSLSLPVLADTLPEANAQVTLTIANPVSSDGRPVTLLENEANVVVLDDDTFFEIRSLPRFRFWGDPHLVTIDGLGYDFQAVGEFTLAETTADDSFLAQVRTSAVAGSDLVSEITAYATRLGASRVSIDVDSVTPLLVDGVAIDLRSGDEALAVGDGLIAFDGTTYTLLYASGEMATVARYDGFLEISLSLNEDRAGKLRGLVGNADGDTTNDLQLPDGTVLSQPLDYEDLYGTFADAWRVTADTSLFDYAPGLGTEDFQDRSFPRAQVTLDDIPADILAWAEAIVDSYGIDDPIARKAAILDVALTGNPQYAESTFNMQEAITSEAVIENAPALGQAIGVGADATRVWEGDDADLTDVGFTVYRMGSSSGVVQVDYILTGDVDADDLEPGQALSGTVTFAEGETQKQILVSLAGDDSPEADEVLRLQIGLDRDAYPDILLAAPVAQAVVQNDDGPLPTTFTLSAVNVSLAEGTGADTTYRFRIERNGDTTAENAVQLRVIDQGSGAGRAGQSDFVGAALPAETIVFTVGEKVKYFELKVAGDTELEGDESFTVQLTALTPGGDVFLTADAVIRNDDFAPVAVDDAFVASANAGVSGNLLANDSDDGPIRLSEVEGNVASVGTQVALPSGALLRVDADGSFDYDPNGAFVALAGGATQVDRFSYTLTDGTHTEVGHASIQVNGVNDAPLARDDTYQVSEDRVATGNLLANDVDPDQEPVSIVSVFGQSAFLDQTTVLPSGALLTVGQGGFLTYNPNGMFEYLGVGQQAVDTIFYAITDGSFVSMADVSFAVQGENDVPEARGDDFTAYNNQPLSGNLFEDNGLGPDQDLDGDELFLASVDVSGLRGLLTYAANGDFVFTPEAGFVGATGFDYVVGDGQGGFAAARAELSIKDFVDSDQDGVPDDQDNDITLMLTAGADLTLEEGQLLSRTVAFTDGEDNGTAGWSYEIDYGDGTTETASTLVESLDLAHIYADGDASRTVTVTVTDEVGESYIDSFTVDVANVVPTLDLIGADTVDEGSPYTLTLANLVDPGADTVSGYTIDWGDGSAPDSVASLGDVIHTFADDGAYTITVTATDEDGSYVFTKPLTVANVDPTVILSGATAIDEGGTYQLGIEGIDPGIQDSLIFDIDWGDGSAVEALTGAELQAQGAIVEHVFADDEDGPVNVTNRSITVTVRDDDGGIGSATRAVAVSNVAPLIALSGAPSVEAGIAYNLTLGAITDPGQDIATSVTIDWGDGTSDQVATDGPVSHTYASEGLRTISVSIEDEDGTHADSGSLDLLVTPADPGNTAPVANPDSYTVHAGAFLSVDAAAGVLANDSDADGDTLSVVAFQPAANGTLNIAADGSFTYASNAGFSGTETVGYTLSDGTDLVTSTLEITVEAAVAIETVRIGDAPTRLSRTNPDGWELAWSHPDIEISHKAVLDDAQEAWSPVALRNLSPLTLAGGDSLSGDLGVSGQTLPSSVVRQEIDGTEGLRFELQREAVGVTADLSHFFLSDDGTVFAETGRIQFLDADGRVLGERYFTAESTSGDQTVSFDFSSGFEAVTFSAGAIDGDDFVFGSYVDPESGEGRGPISDADGQHGSDYLLDWVEFDFVAPVLATAHFTEF